ncbi:MAG: hypothetical protein GY927_23165 [bacterium]|nr:hypothetical protein [bacterium]
MVEALGNNGIACDQFVIDPETKDTCFVEINPGTSAIHRALEALGMELSHVTLVLAGERLDEIGKYEFS